VTARELLMEERRLFYVACTRARERLVVTAVASADDEGEQPSRFLDELGSPGTTVAEHVVGRPARPLSMPGLVAELRRTVADPASDEGLRAAAATRLARLAAEQAPSGRRALVPAADPSTWWGTRAATRSSVPVRAADQPVPVSASMLEALEVCPTQWFLSREAGGVGRAHQSANVGELVHALAQRVATGEAPPDPDALMAHVDEVWDRLDFRTPWSKQREHERVRAALERFVDWHEANPRRVLGLETPFATVVELPDGERVRLTGYADRLEVDSDGRVVVVDLKTGRGKPSDVSVRTHVQLALYQYAVDHGALDEPDGSPYAAGGGELVQLGLEDGRPTATVQAQPAQDETGPERTELRERLARAARLVRLEEFPAVAGNHCRGCAFLPLCPAKSSGSVVSR
jgi:RecB family exonuclease